MDITHRYLESAIRYDAMAKHKISFLSGPRQIGKTTLAKRFLTNSSNYFSYDSEQFRRAWARNPSAALAMRGIGPVVLNEIHKDRFWKRKLKGIYDEDPTTGPYIVTGSARLDIYRKGSDSLLGRYLPYRLHAITIGERSLPPGPDLLFESTPSKLCSLDDLLRLGGFPEPLLKSSEREAARWSRLRLERLVRDDTRDLRMISDLSAFGVLADLLPDKVGSLFSINSLREDVGRAYATVRSWYQVLELLYFAFTIRPYSKRIQRSIRAEPKMYLFDILRISAADKAKRLENLTALHLLKACDYWTDTAQGEFSLHFVRDKSKREVDFLIVRDKHPWMLVECKSGSDTPAKQLLHFSEILKPEHSIQLLRRDRFHKVFPNSGIRVLDYEIFFALLP